MDLNNSSSLTISGLAIKSKHNLANEGRKRAIMLIRTVVVLGLVFANLMVLPLGLFGQDRAKPSVASPVGSDEVAEDKQAASEKPWIALFNGKDLTGWTPKVRYSPLGENYGDTFRVEDGLLKVVYDPKPYPKFGARFGHLFYEVPYSHYRLRAEYRFVGTQCPGGPGWAIRNNGLMLHCQAPESMARDQEFPVSIEVQLLGGDGTQDRTTGNLCTPGTNVVMGGELFLPHCTTSQSKTYHGDQWVQIEVEVRGGERIRHIMEGEVILEYTQPQLDARDKTAIPLIEKSGGELLLSQGYIAIQAESSPIEFRKIELQELSPSKVTLED